MFSDLATKAAPADELAAQAVELSVEKQPPDNWGVGGSWYYAYFNQHVDIIAQWGNPVRERELTRAWYHIHNTLVVGALTNIIRRVKQVAWEIEGDEEAARHFQELFQEAQSGEGWDSFLSQLLQAFLSHDCGGVIEIIAQGESDEPITPDTEIVGIRALDPSHCYFTGRRDYPVYYRDIEGELHKMHETRARRLVDMPASDPLMRGLGLCALSRAIAVVNAQILMSKYLNEKLSDLPPSGIISFSGITANQLQQALQMYEAGRRADGQQVFRNLMQLTSLKPDSPVKIEVTPFAQLPDSYNRKEYMEIDVNLVALAIGDDPQEIWPLTGQNLGTGAQTRILHAKGQAKLFGDILTLLERIINKYILPAYLTFKFKPRDTEQDKQGAETAKMWTDSAVQLVVNGIFNRQTALTLLSNTVPEYRDVLLDPEGNVRLTDDDVSPLGETTLQDDTTAETPGMNDGNEVTVTDDTNINQGQASLKELSSTKEDFMRDWQDLITRAINGRIERRRFGIVARALITRFGRAAYGDGLTEGGVNPSEATPEDLANINRIAAEQSAYVTNFANSIYRGEGLSVAQAEVRPELWFTQSIMPFYNTGVQSADINGMYQFGGRDGQEMCTDCARLKGQIHRLKAWRDRDLIPPTSKTQCKGWRCQHILIKRPGARARGSW